MLSVTHCYRYNVYNKGEKYLISQQLEHENNEGINLSSWRSPRGRALSQCNLPRQPLTRNSKHPRTNCYQASWLEVEGVPYGQTVTGRARAAPHSERAVPCVRAGACRRGGALAARGGGERQAGGAGSPHALTLLLLLLLPAAGADVVFRVPEVLVRHAAAARPVGTGRANGSSESADGTGAGAGGGGGGAAGLVEVRYEEYFVEHDVSTAEARKAAALLDLDEASVGRVGCGACGRRDMEYCETRVLADHCCCERRFLRDPFPWLPHTCYIGPHRCRPLAHDCVQYTRLRDCCCRRHLAQRWKGILSQSPRQAVGAGGASLLLLSMLLFVAYL